MAQFSHGEHLIKHLNINYYSEIEIGWTVSVVSILVLTSNVPNKSGDVGELFRVTCCKREGKISENHLMVCMVSS